ncbi:MAG: T9SS type A sorting domain-containing protein, partial [Candidatus Latescibacterota bacterium]|nr:T9SS type A sorting domain-containing protein [Candidatus Latescibacterota bacterium]
LQQNYPNPFNASTLIGFSLAVPSRVALDVYDLLGQHVATIVNRDLPAGQHRFTWRPDQLASGVYFYRIAAGSFVATRKLLLLQ